MSWEVNQFLQDLSDFNALLKKREVPIDTSSLYNLEGASQGFDDINFNIKDIEFTLNESISGTIPFGVSVYKISIELDFLIDSQRDKMVEDPFLDEKGYSFQLYIKGVVKNQDGKKNEYLNCWHLDRNITGGGENKVIHPFYHFQNGGDNMEFMNTGEIILTAAPRLPHPPLDIFLAIHFIISNFYNRNSHAFVDELFDDDEYILIIERAQQRMWKPYYNAFNGGDHTHYTIDKIAPLYTIH